MCQSLINLLAQCLAPKVTVIVSLAESKRDVLSFPLLWIIFAPNTSMLIISCLAHITIIYIHQIHMLVYI